jgi:hypothetical protein
MNRDVIKAGVLVLLVVVAFVVGYLQDKPADDIYIKEWQAPNGIDRCYVAYYADGRRADIACVEAGGKGD